MVTNLFGALGLDSTLQQLIYRFRGLKFDSQSRVQVYADLGTSQALGQIAGVTTVTTANISIGDSGKNSTIIQQSEMAFQMAVGQNFTKA